MTLKRILTFDVTRILKFDVNRILKWDVGAALTRPITNPRHSDRVPAVPHKCRSALAPVRSADSRYPPEA